jgi:hypothetical protein
MEVKYRQKQKFLWFPKTIEGKTKWLVFGKWMEYSQPEKQFNWFNPILGGSEYGYSDWKPYKWIENDAKRK